uniref:Cyclic AMP receptor-like protein A-like isoform X2 n=1 Tax=Saccoglossus kowalevskii TaxID=10224 RepID=A0ABM0M8X4_SACKO|nr:PREDICTED: cyclic AMP receptor-like protein A-like isoform X2 [Saccoglossus kowalevskii]
MMESVGFSNSSSTLMPSNSTSTPEPGTYCTLFDGNEGKCDAVIAVKRFTASLSLIGCVFMIAVIWLFKKYQFFAQRLILYLSIAALCDSIAYLMGDLHPEGPLCDFQAWWLTFFDWCVLLWVSCITFNLFCNAVRQIKTDRYELIYHVICWGLSLLISLLPFIGDHYGPAGAWCWINGENDTTWRFVIWYGPLFVIIFLMFCIYLYIIIHVNRKVKAWEGTYDPETERSKQLLKEEIKPLLVYPFIYLIISIFPLINRIQNAISHDPIFAFVLLHALTSPLQGAINAIVYGLDKETRSRLTWTQIKVAMQTKSSDRALIREYPLGGEIETPDILDTSAYPLSNVSDTLVIRNSVSNSNRYS